MFKLGEIYKTVGGWRAKVVHVTKHSLLVVHSPESALAMAVWHDMDGEKTHKAREEFSEPIEHFTLLAK